MAAGLRGDAGGRIRRAAFKEGVRTNVEEQGGTLGALRRRANEVYAGNVHELSASAAGHVTYDLGLVHSALLDAQGATSSWWPDVAGVVLRAWPGELVESGAPLLTARCSDRTWPALCHALAEAVSIGHCADAPHGAILEVVGVRER